MRKTVGLVMVVLVALGVLALASTQVLAGPMPGAIFTTMPDGNIVNANVQYPDKTYVYLDGGPGPNAPAGAAALNEGDYYFQVTDPSGKVLLSTDAVKCRKVHVNSSGVIDYVFPATCLKKIKGVWTTADCTHLTGIDVDHPELGAITVQLMPFDDTPNNGGVYKAWMTPVERFVGDPNLVDNGYSPGNYHGFIPAWSKTDNFKVKLKKPFFPPILNVLKFDDSNDNGVKDADEVWITGWGVDITDPLGVVNTLYTPISVEAVPSGIWTTVESQPAGWLQTAAYLDGVALAVSPTVTVNVAGLSGEIHTVVYGNIQLGKIVLCKWYDRNGNGVKDPGELVIQGWHFKLDGVAVNDTEVHLAGVSGADGCATFDNLLPGSYTGSEVMPSGDDWHSSTVTSYVIQLAEGACEERWFGNFCTGQAAFGTKGYWHNKNGLGETTPADIAYLNSLAPWQSPSSYFGAGDEPIDGFFANGTPVAAANGDWGEVVAPAGSALAEQSQFLVDSNSGGDPREQLAQQLDAFIMNCRHRLDSPGATIQLPDGTWIPASDLISQAIALWQSGSDADRNAMEALLDGLNNSSAVPFICNNPCPVVYP